jgi:hypothetical protein
MHLIMSGLKAWSRGVETVRIVAAAHFAIMSSIASCGGLS